MIYEVNTMDGNSKDKLGNEWRVVIEEKGGIFDVSIEVKDEGFYKFCPIVTDLKRYKTEKGAKNAAARFLKCYKLVMAA